MPPAAEAAPKTESAASKAPASTEAKAEEEAAETKPAEALTQETAATASTAPSTATAAEGVAVGDVLSEDTVPADDAVVSRRASASTEGEVAPIMKAPTLLKKFGSRPGGEKKEATVEQKFHSAVRWGKTKEEIQVVLDAGGATFQDVVNIEDPQNGNQSLHIATQNGHTGLVRILLENRALVNGQNKKGQSALHMSVEYDFYFQTKVLLEAGADRDQTNVDGHPAILGINGGKEGQEAWDCALTMFRASWCVEEMEEAFVALEAATPREVSTESLAEVAEKKCKEAYWDQARYERIVARHEVATDAPAADSNQPPAEDAPAAGSA